MLTLFEPQCWTLTNHYAKALTVSLLMWSYHSIWPFNKARLAVSASTAEWALRSRLLCTNMLLKGLKHQQRYVLGSLVYLACHQAVDCKISSRFRDEWAMTLCASFQMLFTFNQDPCDILFSLQTFQPSSQMSEEPRLVFSICWLG